MKKFHKILPVMVLALVVLFASIVRTEAAEGKPGQTVSVSFTFNDVRGIDGNFVFSNRDMFSDVSYSSSFPGARFNNDKIFYSTSSAGTSNGTVTVTATIKSDAAVGSTCTITLDNINITDANTNSVYSGSKSEVVTVVKEPVSNQTQVQISGNDSTQAGNQTSNQSQTQTQSDNQQSVTTSSGNKSTVDLTELKKQLEIANGLEQNKYTKASWDAYTVALNNAKSALNSGSQSKVDDAALSLKNAIVSLVEIDYSKLQKAIDEANSYMDSDATAALIKQIMTAVNNGSTLLDSADQAAIDNAADEINKLLEQALEGKSSASSVNTGGNTVIAEPAYDYCNITMHKVWPILFFISLAANIVLVVLIVLSVRRKRIRTGEDMPLVDYDIEDDDIMLEE